MNLQEFFTQNPRVALGFSGGVDSAYLLYAAKTYGAQVGAYYIKTAFQPAFELEDAKALAKVIGVPLTVVEADILAVTMVKENPGDRCYYCKKALFQLLKVCAAQDGYTLLLDGTNASDEVTDRPGMQALLELEVRSPLRECGLSKTDIRLLSKEAGLFTWNKPAYACLATRIPKGQRITAERLSRVEEAENALMHMGFSDFRVRLLGEAARLQLPAEHFALAIARREELCKVLAPYFTQVFLDLTVVR